MAVTFHPMTPTNPTDKCSLCWCSAEEKPNKPWVGHVVNNIKSWGDYFQSWVGRTSSSSIHMFHKKCLKKYFKGKFQMCPGQCLQRIDPSFFLSSTERIARSANIFLKNAVIGTVTIGLSICLGIGISKASIGEITGSALGSIGIFTMLGAVGADIRTAAVSTWIGAPIVWIAGFHGFKFNNIPETVALSIFSGVVSAGILTMMPSSIDPS